jgi:hypothetical protein
LAVLASGSGTQLTNRTTVERLASLEAAQPKGTRMILSSRWAVVRVPVAGAVHTGAIAAAAVNEAYRAGRIRSNAKPLALWPGDTLPARYDPSTRTVTVRWLNGSAFVAAVIAAMAGVTAGVVASVLGVPAGTALTVGVLAAIAVGAAFVARYLLSWVFGTSGASGHGVGFPVILAVAVAMPIAALAIARSRNR